VYNLVRWLGGGWENLGGQLLTINVPGFLEKMVEGPDGSIYIVGVYGSGSLSSRGCVKWNGSTFVAMDFRMLAGAVGNDIQINEAGDIYFAETFTDGTPVLVSHVNVIINPGSAEATPVFYVRGPGRLVWIENQTTHKTMYFDLAIFPGEEVIIDTMSHTIRSNTRPNLLEYISPGSDFGNFTLLPGENKIACFMYDDVDGSLSVQFSVKHWSADAGGDGTQL
jgi:hypothetical protein